MTVMPRNDLWSISRDYTGVISLNQGPNSTSGKKNHFQLRYIDVTRVTQTALDVSQESRVDEDRDLSEAWTRFTRFTILSGKYPDGYTWFRERLTGRQHQGQIICGQKFGQTCERQLNGKKIKNGRAKNRSLTMQGCCEAFILSLWKIRNSRNHEETHGRRSIYGSIYVVQNQKWSVQGNFR